MIMLVDESFDFAEFTFMLRGVPPGDRRNKVAAELERVSGLTVREARQKFQQQLFMSRLERLVRFLDGEDVSGELTPSEKTAYAALGGPKPAAQAPVAPSKGAPEAAPAAEPQGKNRRQARRIQMKTRVRIRRDSDPMTEVLEPLDVSKGGVSFQSPRRFALHEIIWVSMHYKPGVSAMAVRSQIVRVAPIPQSVEFSYGAKFLAG
jgi:hypothetical protein